MLEAPACLPGSGGQCRLISPRLNIPPCGCPRATWGQALTFIIANATVCRWSAGQSNPPRRPHFLPFAPLPGWGGQTDGQADRWAGSQEGLSPNPQIRQPRVCSSIRPNGRASCPGRGFPTHPLPALASRAKSKLFRSPDKQGLTKGIFFPRGDSSMMPPARGTAPGSEPTACGTLATRRDATPSELGLGETQSPCVPLASTPRDRRIPPHSISLPAALPQAVKGEGRQRERR